MKRKTEKIFIRLGASWSILTAILTIFGYSLWFKDQGVNALMSENKLNYATSSTVDNIVRVVMIFGLLVLAMGIANLFVAKFLENQLMDKKVVIWLSFCVLIDFLSFDFIGVFFYLVSVVIYVARNRAYRKTVAQA